MPDILSVKEGARGENQLKEIMGKVCDLVAFYELAIRVNESSDVGDFYPLLTEVISDACNWVSLNNY